MPLYSDLLAALHDEDLHNVTLVGLDGGIVEANKTILALRSPVWKRMFVGSFAERDSDRVPMNYLSVVLRVVVTYCYTDELDLDALYEEDESSNAAEEAANGGTSSSALLTDDEAVAMVQLRDAANYLELPSLHKYVTNELGDTLKKDLSCAIPALNEFYLRGDDGPFWDILIDMIQASPAEAFLPSNENSKGILECTFGLLTIFFGPKSSDGKEGTENDHGHASLSFPAFETVRTLQLWSQYNAESLAGTEEGRRAQEELKRIANAVNLHEIPAHQLSEIKPCALFSMERLYEAFVHRGSSTTCLKTPTFNFEASNEVAVVRGAGVSCLDGVYFKQHGTSWSKTGIYGDVPCTFTIRLLPGVWQLVVCLIGSNKILVLYDGKCGETSTDPPFALWSCVDGQDPTPYVVTTKKPRKSKSFMFTTGSPVAKKQTHRQGLFERRGG